MLGLDPSRERPEGGTPGKRQVMVQTSSRGCARHDSAEKGGTCIESRDRVR